MAHLLLLQTRYFVFLSPSLSTPLNDLIHDLPCNQTYYGAHCVLGCMLNATLTQTKHEYVSLLIDAKMGKMTRAQHRAMKEGFSSCIPDHVAGNNLSFFFLLVCTYACL